MRKITLDQALALQTRLESRTRKTESCWLWTKIDGSIAAKGGRLKYGSRTDNTRAEISVHVLSFIVSNEYVPELGVLHHCDVPACVNPAHLYEGTPADNMRDMRVRKRSPKAQLTHCHRNHEFTVENTKLYKNGTRHCKECGRINARARYQRKKGS